PASGCVRAADAPRADAARPGPPRRASRRDGPALRCVAAGGPRADLRSPLATLGLVVLRERPPRAMQPRADRPDARALDPRELLIAEAAGGLQQDQRRIVRAESLERASERSADDVALRLFGKRCEKTQPASTRAQHVDRAALGHAIEKVPRVLAQRAARPVIEDREEGLLTDVLGLLVGGRRAARDGPHGREGVAVEI